MNPIRLKPNANVCVKGKDFWGREAKIVFSSYPKEINNWYWRFDGGRGNVSLPITPDIVSCCKRRTRLFNFCPRRNLEIWEHLGVLRWFGLCGLIISSSPWPPYFGRPLEFWLAIKQECQEDNSGEIRWHTLKQTVGGRYNDENRFTIIKPLSPNEQKLKVTIIIDYPGIGPYEMNFSLPNNQLLEEICSSYSPGWPPPLYYLSKASSFFGWPHHNHTFWPGGHYREEALKNFAYHRAADLLGALSLLCHGKSLLAAQVISWCSGHLADLEAVKKAQVLPF